MCLPKFTADRSLDRTAEPYGLIGATARQAGGAKLFHNRTLFASMQPAASTRFAAFPGWAAESIPIDL